MNSKLLVGLVVLVLGVAAGWYVLQNKNTPSQTNTVTGQVTNPTTEPFATSAPLQTTGVPGTEKGGVPSGDTLAKVTVSLTDSGFSPSTVTVKVGTTVTFVNNSSGSMWVASDVHPTHQLLPGFDELKSVPKGGTYDYTFVKVGTWTYHNHVAPSVKGTVVVTK